MHTITVEHTVAAPIGPVFEWLSDASNYTRSPVVLRARLTHHGVDAPYGRDAVRVLTWVMGRFRERITAYHPPHDFAYLVERSFPPSRHEGGAVTLSEIPGGTKVVWTTTAQIALPFGADAMTRTVAAPVISWAFRHILRTADRALRTEPTGTPGK